MYAADLARPGSYERGSWSPPVSSHTRWVQSLSLSCASVVLSKGANAVRSKLVRGLKTVRHPVLWLLVAWVCRCVALLSLGNSRQWKYRNARALELAGRSDAAVAAYRRITDSAATTRGAAGVSGGNRRGWAAEVELERRRARETLRRSKRKVKLRRKLARAFRRRGRVVPVVTWGRRRKWARAAPDDWASRLHWFYLQKRDTYLPSFFAKFNSYPMPVGVSRWWWWFGNEVIIQSFRMVRSNGRSVAKAAGVPVYRQLLQGIWLSITLPCRPENYYKYELYKPANRARANDYLHSHENSPVFCAVLAELGGSESAPPLTDKVAFAEFAKSKGLPVVETLAVVADKQVQIGEQGDLPKASIFVKPIDGKHGKQAQKWEYLSESDTFRLLGKQLEFPRTSVLEEMRRRLPRGSFIIQPCLVNHPELLDLTLNAVATCRIITITNEQGEPEPVISIFRMPAVAGAVVDNMHGGGLASPVDIKTGMLGSASDYGTEGVSQRYSRHPVTGGTIEGRVLPYWSEVLTVVREAHRSFSPRLLIGWDICIGPNGPVIVEGNEQPGVGGLQRLHETPLGSHRFGQLFAYHLIGSTSVAEGLVPQGQHDRATSVGPARRK